MTAMHFLPELQKYLNRHGIIYTVRRFKYDGDSDGVSYVYILDVGGCERTLTLEAVEFREIIPYANESGFDSPEDWWDKIKSINRHYPKAVLYLYKVRKLR